MNDKQLTRRQFLTNLATALPAVALAGCAVSVATDDAPIALESALDSDYITIHKSLLEYAPEQPPPYGPADRTAVIEKWIGRLDEVLITLERYYGFLIEARGLAQGQVDGVKLVNLENDVYGLCDHLVGCIDCDYENSLITAVTGRSSAAVCVETELKSDSHQFDRAFWQREVEAVCEDHPEERARLQALLDARYVGVQ